MTLRDHAQPCEHGPHHPAGQRFDGSWNCVHPGCPGGEAVAIDYAMVSAWLATLTPNEGRDVAQRLHKQADAAARILLAAIGDTKPREPAEEI